VKIIILGGGRVGKAIAEDMAQRHEVVVADPDQAALDRIEKIQTLLLRPGSEGVAQAAEGFDLAICAVPGAVGFACLRALIEAQVAVVDISFFPEDALELDSLAKEKGVIAAVDMGVAPGLDHLILGHHDGQMKVDSFVCLVGGLPKERNSAFQYKAPFSPADVIEEYLQPARFMQNGKQQVEAALSNSELVEFEGVGTLEAFLTDGLRSLLETMGHIPNMIEKTLRYPGHREQMLALREAGFFEKDLLEVGGAKISPKEVTCKVLFKEWELGPTEEEFTVMRVTVVGEGKEHVWELLDRTDVKLGISSMARTTGYTCCAVAEAILAGLWTRPGVIPGEILGRQPGMLEYVVGFLRDRGVNISLRTNV
jgi:saccharopine dehydrogenase-like NADP-dependent oxidoreductase